MNTKASHEIRISFRSGRHRSTRAIIQILHIKGRVLF